MKHEIKRSLLVLGVSLAALGAVTFVAAHGGPVAPGIIHSCVNNSSGEIKIVGSDASCKQNQSALDWNGEGPAGPAGPAGPTGPAGVLGFYVITGDTTLANTNANQGFSSARCDAGDMATGGGFRLEDWNFPPTIGLFTNEPITWEVGYPNGWNVHFFWDDTTPATQGLHAYVVCADMTP